MTVAQPTIALVGAAAGNYSKGRIAPDGTSVAPEAWVLHIAQGSFAGIASWFNDARAGVSAHFSVAKDGRIQQHVAVADTAFANGIIQTGYTAALIDENGGMNPNLWSVSCEHEGNSGDDVPQAQFDASTRLCAWVFQQQLLTGGASGVAVDRKHILRHADISPIDRAGCPGWSEVFISTYIARVKVLLTPAGVPLPPPLDPRIQKAIDDITALAIGLEDVRDRAALQAQSARAAVAALAKG